MSPELERLLTALYERETCSPQDRPKWDATFRRLMADALASQPGTSYDALVEALRGRYVEFRRARRQPPALPPNA